MDVEEILNEDLADEGEENELNENLLAEQQILEEENLNNNLIEDENENNLILEEENELNQKIFVDKQQILEEENELNQIILVDEQIFEKEDENIYISTLTSPIITTCENINETSSPYKQDNQHNPLAEEQIGEFKKLVDYSFSSASSTFAPFPTPSLTIEPQSPTPTSPTITPPSPTIEKQQQNK
uniref:Candidate secreted effector n=1 Tax=Meloidogyne incognita TaxID=6306 RepID=A0A914L213_MELIC